MTHNSAPCFCCSQLPFSECCEPILLDHARALTPEMLMRSRYTAYVLGKEEYLLATWDPSTRPQTLSLEENPVKWLRLTIHSAGDGPADEDMGAVDFSAEGIDRDQLCILRETSRFRRHKGLWYYLDGSCRITHEKVGRNSPCPCGSGKKFKRCCLAS